MLLWNQLLNYDQILTLCQEDFLVVYKKEISSLFHGEVLIICHGEILILRYEELLICYNQTVFFTRKILHHDEGPFSLENASLAAWKN